MRKNLRRLIPLFVACTIVLGGCTSPQKAKKQLILDLKSIAFLLQLSGETTAAQYHMHISENEASLLSAQTSMGEENFQKQVKSGKEQLVKNAETLLTIQQQILPNAIIYVTNLPSLGITQEHLDTMFENDRAANVSFSTCMNKAEKNGIKTNFKDLEDTLAKGKSSLQKADETLQKLQTAINTFLAGYNQNADDLGWKIAMKSNLTSIEQTRASAQLLNHCSALIDTTVLLSDYYTRFSEIIFRRNQLGGFSSAEISECKSLLQTVTQKLEEQKASEQEIQQITASLKLDSAVYTKTLSELQTTVQKAQLSLSAMESSSDSQGQLAASVSEFEKAYETLSASQAEMAQLIQTFTKQLLDHLCNL